MPSIQLRNPTPDRTKGTHMRGTPVYYLPSKKITNAQFYRNFWCSHYAVCLNTAAREDLYLDCTQCELKENTPEDFGFTQK
jgi:hypothetical protein